MPDDICCTSRLNSDGAFGLPQDLQSMPIKNPHSSKSPRRALKGWHHYMLSMPRPFGVTARWDI